MRAVQAIPIINVIGTEWGRSILNDNNFAFSARPIAFGLKRRNCVPGLALAYTTLTTNHGLLPPWRVISLGDIISSSSREISSRCESIVLNDQSAPFIIIRR